MSIDINQIVSQLTPYAEKGWAVGEKIQIINGVENIVVGVVCGALALIVIRLGIPNWRKLFSGKFSILDDGSEQVVLTSFVLGTIALIFMAVSLSDLLDPWTWVSIFDPSLAFAHHLLNKS